MLKQIVHKNLMLLSKKNLKDKTVITKKLTEQQVKEQMARGS